MNLLFMNLAVRNDDEGKRMSGFEEGTICDNE